MRLRATREMTVTIDALGMSVPFAAGRGDADRDQREVHPRRVADDLAQAGLEPARG